MTERGERLALALERELTPGADAVSLREQAAAVLRGRFRYGVGVWATVDPLTTMWTSCVLDGFERDPELESAVFDNEYRVPDVLKLRDLARDRRGGAGALSLETGGDPVASTRFREVLEPRGVTDELRVVLTVDGTSWGAVVLLASEGRFDPDDVAALRGISRPLGARLRAALLADTAALPRAGAGVVLCDERGRVLDLSPEAAALLGVDDPQQVPAAVGAAVVRFVVDGAGGSVTAAGSTWLTVRCTRLGGRVLAVVDRIDPHRLADVLIGAAGLTPRERTVLEAVLAGATTRAAAVRLAMSEHTVNDHLKRIFTKFHVGSRAELVARLFTDHYAAPHAAGAAPSARGHYLSTVSSPR